MIVGVLLIVLATASNGAATQSMFHDNAAVSFAIPDQCQLKPPELLDGLTLNEVQQWKREVTNFGLRDASAHVTLLHWDGTDLWTALENRRDPDNGQMVLGHPGGLINNWGETLAEGVARQTRSKTGAIPSFGGNDVHLLSANKFELKNNKLGLYAHFTAFVNDKSAIQGQFQWYRLEKNFDLPIKMKPPAWKSLLGALEKLKQQIICDSSMIPGNTIIPDSNYPICTNGRGRAGATSNNEISKRGRVFFTYANYDQLFFKEMQDIMFAKGPPWGTILKLRRPLIVFGDNDKEWCRPVGTNRGQSFGQSGGLSNSQMDRTIAYGLVTDFQMDNSPFKNDDQKFKEMIQSQFAELTEELEMGSDIYFPVQDSSLKPSTRIPLNDGWLPVYHNLGTGAANLKAERLQLIADEIAKLVQVSGQRAARMSFDKPASCIVNAPRFQNGLNQATVSQWTFQAGQPKAMAHVILLHWDGTDLWTLLHRRMYFVKNNDLGHPGGLIDHPGETMAEGVTRETREESIRGSTIRDSDVYLLGAKILPNGKYYGYYAAFLRDKEAVTRPKEEDAHELYLDPPNGFVEPSRQQWFRIKKDGTLDLPPALQGKVWFSLREILDEVKAVIQCR